MLCTNLHTKTLLCWCCRFSLFHVCQILFFIGVSPGKKSSYPFIFNFVPVSFAAHHWHLKREEKRCQKKESEVDRWKIKCWKRSLERISQYTLETSSPLDFCSQKDMRGTMSIKDAACSVKHFLLCSNSVKSLQVTPHFKGSIISANSIYASCFPSFSFSYCLGWMSYSSFCYFAIIHC